MFYFVLATIDVEGKRQMSWDLFEVCCRLNEFTYWGNALRENAVSFMPDFLGNSHFSITGNNNAIHYSRKEKKRRNQTFLKM